MPWWIGKEPSQPPEDQRIAKVVADLALLLRAAQAAIASLGDVGTSPPSRMAADVRTRVVAMQYLCGALVANGQLLMDLLDAGPHERGH
jgi:hypothetical protein